MEERIDRGYKIAYVGNNLLNLGFKIAGVTESYVATDTAQAESRMKELTARDDIGIIIITSSIRRLIKDRRLSETISTSLLPLIMEIPEPNEQVLEEDTLRNLIIRAIGIDIMKD
jgi:vacuolar-type H+-ATPase subunit F/Vma7